MLASVVKVVHGALIVFLTVIPLFFWNEHLLTIAFLMAGLIMLHWLLNNNVCALTTLEAKLRGVEDTGETFIGQFVNPVYELTNRKIWAATGALFLIAAFKLGKYHKFELLKNILHVKNNTVPCESTSSLPSLLPVSSAAC